MANTTFMGLANKLLQRFNEVQISQSDFMSVVDIQGAAKEAINDTLRQILAEHYQWTFNAEEQEDTLVAGTFEYDWPSDYRSVEWTSFQLQADDTLGVNVKNLRHIERNAFYDRHYEDAREGVANSAYRGVPEGVYQSYRNGYGVYKNPDAAYKIKYRYYKTFTPLSAYNDTSTIPSEYDHTIIYGAMVHMNLFLDNNDQAEYVQRNLYEPALRSMRTLLINDDQYMSDTRVQNINVR